MRGMLHITDGDSVIHSFRGASLWGEYVSWIDPSMKAPFRPACISSN
jgi:hypothetical protein